jgi:HK97 gp10 family phage protein
MAADIQFTVRGIDDLKAALKGLAPNLRRRALRNALAAGGRVFAAEAKRRVPVLRAPIMRGGQLARKPGTVRDAIRVRTSKLSSRRGDVGVFVNVVPAKGARFRTVRGGAVFGLLNRRVQTRKSQRGKYSPNDPFYWRFLEFGWNPATPSIDGKGNRGKRARRQLVRARAAKRKPGAGFLRGAVSRQAEALRAIESSLGPQIQKLNDAPVRFRR